MVHLEFKATNNMAEYETLIFGVSTTLSIGVSAAIFERRLQQPTARLAEPGEGGETNTSKLTVPTTLIPWCLSRIVGVTGDSVHPDAQDPEAQVGPNTWITEIQTYLKDNILPDDSAFADRIARLTKRYTLIEGISANVASMAF
jgi:hypothetical protein